LIGGRLSGRSFGRIWAVRRRLFDRPVSGRLGDSILEPTGGAFYAESRTRPLGRPGTPVYVRSVARSVNIPAPSSAEGAPRPTTMSHGWKGELRLHGPSLPDEATASGRATRRASSDPACLWARPALPLIGTLNRLTKGPRRTPGIVDPQAAGPTPGKCWRGTLATGYESEGQGPLICPPPKGATPRDRPPRGGLPNTPASGRGCLLDAIEPFRASDSNGAKNNDLHRDGCSGGGRKARSWCYSLHFSPCFRRSDGDRRRGVVADDLE
jgi:hypothetical protein